MRAPSERRTANTKIPLTLPLLTTRSSLGEGFDARSVHTQNTEHRTPNTSLPSSPLRNQILYASMQQHPSAHDQDDSPDE